MKLKVSEEEALNRLESIPHETCRKGIERHWLVKNGEVKAQDVCWLFCWAKTGTNSPTAAAVSKRVFEQLLPIDFDHFDRCVPHEFARTTRYASGDFEMELAAMLRA